MTSRSVYLWILPMFHCDGWCFPCGVTAVAGTHVCLRKMDPGRIWDLLEAEHVSHYCAAPTVQIDWFDLPIEEQAQMPRAPGAGTHHVARRAGRRQEPGRRPARRPDPR
jgi:acyl-CoA synthetase (AMP-forming)/AMP-acid ligase II